jgi:hypothetical protein
MMIDGLETRLVEMVACVPRLHITTKRFILHHVHHLDQKPGVLVFNLCICHTGDSAKLSVCYRCSSLAF